MYKKKVTVAVLNLQLFSTQDQTAVGNGSQTTDIIQEVAMLFTPIEDGLWGNLRVGVVSESGPAENKLAGGIVFQGESDSE